MNTVIKIQIDSLIPNLTLCGTERNKNQPEDKNYF